MPRKVVDKTSFLGGEAGYLLEGRSDLAQFQLGASRLENFVALKSGPATRRPGTRYVKTTQGNRPARVIDWVISHDSAEDIFGVEIALASASTLTVRIIRRSDFSVYTPTGAPTISVTADIDLNEIQYSQSASAIFICHKSFAPQVIFRTAATTFFIDPYIENIFRSHDIYESLPYMTRNISLTTLSIDVATTGAGRIVTASTPIFPDASVIGSYYRMRATTANGWFQITGWTSTTVVTVQVIAAIDAAATATTDWSEGAWSAYRGWPRTVTFYNQRIVFGGTTTQPDTFWLSQVGDYYQMSTFDATTPFNESTGISDSLSFTLASDKLNDIKWMVGGKKLTIGTGSSEWVGTVTNDGTNLFLDFNEETNHGSAYTQPRKIAYSIPFVQRSKKTIRELTFNFDSDSYQATDLSLFASHIGTSYGRFSSITSLGIVQVAYQESPFGVYWVIDSVGRLYGLTRDIQQQVAAWHSHVIGGRLTDAVYTGGAGADYPAFVTSISVLPDVNGELDQLWMVVRRSINGTDTYHVEYMDDIKSNSTISPGTTGDIRAFLDCASIATAASTVTWNGYTRFAGESVYVIAEASGGEIVYSGLLTVSGAGVITLPVAATKVVVGLHANAEVRLLPSVGGNNPELTLLSAKGVDTAAIKLYQTYGLRVGKHQTQGKAGVSENEDFEPIPFDSSGLPIITTFTGVKEIQVPSDTDHDGSFALVMEEPWPCTILSISSRTVFNEV